MFSKKFLFKAELTVIGLRNQSVKQGSIPVSSGNSGCSSEPSDIIDVAMTAQARHLPRTIVPLLEKPA